MMNRRVIAFCISLVIVIGGIWIVTNTSKNKSSTSPESNNDISTYTNTDAEKFSSEYKLVDKDNRFKYATASQVLEIFEKGSGIVFLGFPSCPWCQQLAPLVDKAAKESNIPVIYYLNIRDLHQNNDSNYQAIIKKLAPHLKQDESGSPRVYVPDVSALHKGEIVGRFEQEATSEGEQQVQGAEDYWSDQGRRDRAVEHLNGIMTKSKLPNGLNNALQTPGAQLIDVRTPQEFAQEHIKQSINIPLTDDFTKQLPNQITKDTPIYLYCRSGNRSNQAAQQLISSGYINVYDLGSIEDVKQLGGKV